MGAATRTTRVTRTFAAPRRRVYAALTDPADVVRWRFPVGMTCRVHEFDARVGGHVRVSLTYDDPARPGKTSGHTDTYRGRFTRLVADELVVEVDEFETDDPALRGEMTTTVTLADDGAGGTVLTAVHTGLPPGVAAADNATGWEQALDRLAAVVDPAAGRPLLPVACDLDASDGARRVEDWARIVDWAGRGRETAPGRVTLRFAGAADVRAEVERLVAAERVCCAFLDWQVVTAGSETHVHIRGTDEQLRSLPLGS